jgi:tRNA splicing endonuclease
MKRTIVTLGCLLLAPLAFAQPSLTNKKQTTTEPVTVTGAVIKMTTEEGAAASYQPIRTLVIREDNSKNAERYVLSGRGHVLNKAGQVVQTAIKPGARVRVYYANTSDLRTIDHVVVVD